jgi:trehalose 6-phosphate phosphatase
MRPLLESEGRAALAGLAEGKPLLAFDFDGTLAPIVARPQQARVPLAVASRLDRIAHGWPIVVLGGRAAADLAGRLGFGPRFIVGNHGIENPFDARCGAWPAALDAARAQLAALDQRLEREGVCIEDKGFSIALHYRLAPNPARARAAIDAVLQRLGTGVRSQDGASVVDVLPAGAPDKADALRMLAARCGADRGLFVGGGDVGDEAAYTKLGPTWVTVRTGPCNARSAARFRLGATSLLPALLQSLLELRPP